MARQDSTESQVFVNKKSVRGTRNIDGIPGSLENVSNIQESRNESSVNFQSSEYICMMVCHSIAVNDELNFNKFVKKLKVILSQDPDNDDARDMLRFFVPISWRKIPQFLLLKEVRKFMSQAIQFSIRIKREIITNDILNLSKSRFIQVNITDTEMEILIREEMYDMIEKLILGNILLMTDASHLDVDEMFQAQRLLDKQKEKEQEANRRLGIIAEDSEA